MVVNQALWLVLLCGKVVLAGFVAKRRNAVAGRKFGTGRASQAVLLSSNLNLVSGGAFGGGKFGDKTKTCVSLRKDRALPRRDLWAGSFIALAGSRG